MFSLPVSTPAPETAVRPVLTFDGALVGIISRGGAENGMTYQGDGVWSESILAIKEGLRLTETCKRCFQ